MPKLPGLPFVRSGVTAGLSANQAFRDYQQAALLASQETGEHWTASNRSVFLQMYSQSRMARAQVEPAMNAPKDEPGGGLSPVKQSTVRATGYGHWTVGFVRPIGSSEIQPIFHLQRSDTLLTPEEVEAQTRADIEASQEDEHGSLYRNVIEGIVFTGVQEFIPTEGA